MTDPLERLADEAHRVEQRMTWETGNRRGLLWTHALVGLWAGPLMWLYGSASVIETAVGVWVRPVLAGLALAGGIFLALGLLQRPRHVVLEALGLAFLVVWDLCMVAGLIYARLKQADFAFKVDIEAIANHLPIVTFEPLPSGYVVAYPIPVYAGYCMLLGIHLWTLRKLRRQQRGRSDAER